MFYREIFYYFQMANAPLYINPVKVISVLLILNAYLTRKKEDTRAYVKMGIWANALVRIFSIIQDKDFFKF